MAKTIGEKLALLAKTQGKSQSVIADNIGMAPSQLNRFFRGNCDFSSPNLFLVMKELGLDIEEMISKKTKKFVDIDEAKVDNVYDCITYMYRSIDDLGQQTYLKQLAWATTATTKKPLPQKVQDIIKKETHLI